MLRSESCPGSKLTCILEVLKIGKLGNEDLNGGFTNARDGEEKFLLGEKLLLLSNELLDALTDVLDLFLLSFDSALYGALNSWKRDRFEFGFEGGIVLRDAIGIATQFFDLAVFVATGAPGTKACLLGLEELGNEFGVGGIAFVAPEFLVSVGFDLPWIDKVD